MSESTLSIKNFGYMFWQQGQLIYNGKYKIEKYLGGGGFAVTYKALHTHLNRQVVIKTPNINVQRDPDYPKYVERFKKEARMLAMCCADSHPYIVQVFDFFEEESRYCLEMQYIAGESLWEYVQRQGALAETEAVKYIRQIGSALVDVHNKKGVLHLDVTPANIMLSLATGISHSSKAVLIDFGIAGDMSPPSTLSRSFGNQAFAPYELIRRGIRHPTVDVYCLAASLYYAVTGQRPTNSFDRKYDKEELVQPKQLVSSLSDAVNHAILEGMALEAKDRPQTMQDWLNLLSGRFSLVQPDEENKETESVTTNNLITNNQINSQLPKKLHTSKSIVVNFYKELLERIEGKEEILLWIVTRKIKHSHQIILNEPEITSHQLSSSVQVDYHNLENLLKAQKWQKADEETARLMLKVAGREEEGWLNTISINNFPCTDLRTIEQLWVKYSNGHFGFSVQKRIWQDVKGNPNADLQTYIDFCQRVGWYNDQKWLFYTQLTFNTNSPEGHLPGCPLIWLWNSFDNTEHQWWDVVSSLSSRLTNCNIVIYENR